MKTLKKYNDFVNEYAGHEHRIQDTIKNGARAVKDFFKGVVSREKALDIINDHAMKRRLYDSMLKNEPEKAEKLIEFIMEKPNTTYFSWNPQTNEFIETGYSGMRESLKESLKEELVTEKMKTADGKEVEAGNTVWQCTDKEPKKVIVNTGTDVSDLYKNYVICKSKCGKKDEEVKGDKKDDKDDKKVEDKKKK